MATKGTGTLNSIFGLEDEEKIINESAEENAQQGVYSNVPRVQAKHSGLHVGNLDNDYTNDEDDKDVGKGTVLADDGNYKSPYETKEGIKQVEDGTRQQEDNTNHDSNKVVENDDVDVTPVKTTEETQNGDTYRTMEDIAKIFQTRADEEEKESQANEAELKRTAKRRMLLAGIADAANSFHQAYAYARGIKPMNENKGYAKEVRKELREDLDWLRKNKDMVLNYRAKVAEIQRTIASLKNQDRLRDQQEAAQQYRYDRLKLDIQKAADTKALNEKKLEIQEMLALGRINKWQHDMLMDEIDKQIKQQNADTSSKNAETNAVKAGGYTKEKTDEFGNKIIETSTPNVSNSSAGGTSSNSNAGTSKSSEDNTPPSKRPKGNNDSTPPSRRK